MSYWGRRVPFAALSGAGVRRHVERRALVSRKYDEARAEVTAGLPGDLTDLALPGQRAALRRVHRSRLDLAWAAENTVRYPPEEEDFLPTALGNALRAAERTAGERYGWSTVDTWPRLYPHVPPASATAYESITDAVDAAAVFCMTFTTIALVTVVAYYDDPALIWIPAASALLAFVSYRGAIASVGVQRTFQYVAFDLYRFDLVKNLHVRLPLTPTAENEQARAMSAFLAEVDPDSAVSTFPAAWYAHPPDGG